MIRYMLVCDVCEHGFDGWFAGSEAFDRLAQEGQIECPECGSSRVSKQIMAPAVRRGRTEPSGAADPDTVMREFAKRAREHVARNFDYVGDGFADEARAMYYGEQEDRPIWGETTAEEREALVEEGIPALPLPAPFAPTKPRQGRRKPQMN